MQAHKWPKNCAPPARLRVRQRRGVEQAGRQRDAQARRLLRHAAAGRRHVGGQRAAHQLRVGQFGAEDGLRRRLLHRHGRVRRQQRPLPAGVPQHRRLLPVLVPQRFHLARERPRLQGGRLQTRNPRALRRSAQPQLSQLVSGPQGVRLALHHHPGTPHQTGHFLYWNEIFLNGRFAYTSGFRKLSRFLLKMSSTY